MLLLVPIGTDNPLGRKPGMNYILIVMNVIIFLATQRFLMGRATAQEYVFFENLMLNPQIPQLHQFITYAFLHGGWLHLIGNMLFLYIFGNNVNEKLGHFGYLLLYLAGAVFSGLGHALVADSPVLGASGAVAAITGAYMVLFPKTHVHVFYWIIYFIGTTEFRALYFILFKLIIYDNMVEPSLAGPGNIAYSAHLAGYIFGVAIPMALLALRLLPHSQFDLWAVTQRWHRRAEYRRTVRGDFDPYATRRKVDVKVTDSHSLDDPHEEEVLNLRADIARAANSSDLATAAQTYLHLIELDASQVLPQQQQLDVANKLMQIGQHATAAAAYEAFLQHYHRYPFIEQVQLMLGLLYSRYLNQKEPAQKHLKAALEKLAEPNQRQMCQDELERLN